eukprot:7059278-Pyramimonas_sp.AAC.1
MCKGFHGLRAVRFQTVDLASAPRTFVFNRFQEFRGSPWTARVPQLRWFAVLMSHEWRPGTAYDRQDGKST